jgi:hypothetical protein
MNTAQMTLELPETASAGCDRNEAPAGYYAVLKSVAKPKDGGNICRACDWRKTCQAAGTDFFAPGHRCMSTPVVAFRDGKTYARRDGASVLFKRKAES